MQDINYLQLKSVLENPVRKQVKTQQTQAQKFVNCLKQLNGSTNIKQQLLKSEQKGFLQRQADNIQKHVQQKNAQKSFSQQATQSEINQLLNNNFYKPPPPPNYLKPKKIDIDSLIKVKKIYDEVDLLTKQDYLYQQELRKKDEYVKRLKQHTALSNQEKRQKIQKQKEKMQQKLGLIDQQELELKKNVEKTFTKKQIDSLRRQLIVIQIKDKVNQQRQINPAQISMPMPVDYKGPQQYIQQTPIGKYVTRNLTVDKKVMTDYINQINQIQFSKYYDQNYKIQEHEQDVLVGTKKKQNINYKNLNNKFIVEEAVIENKLDYQKYLEDLIKESKLDLALQTGLGKPLESYDININNQNIKELNEKFCRAVLEKKQKKDLDQKIQFAKSKIKGVQNLSLQIEKLNQTVNIENNQLRQKNNNRESQTPTNKYSISNSFHTNPQMINYVQNVLDQSCAQRINLN